MARLTIVTIVVAVAAILLVFELLRGRRLRQKFALEEQARRLAEEVGAMRLRLEDVEWRARAGPQMGAGTASSSEADRDETGVGRGREVGLPQPVVDQQLLLRRQSRGQAAAGGA
jgi:hypothetical protein